MSGNNINKVREHLFNTLEALSNKEDPMDLDRAKTISDVCQTIINSAKVEVDYLKVTGQSAGSGFLESPKVIETDDDDLPKGIAGRRQHRLK